MARATVTPSTIALRPFTATDVTFFAGLAGDEQVTRFVGDGRPWSSAVVAERVAPALHPAPIGEVGAARWFVAEERGEAVGVLVSTRRPSAVEIGYWIDPRHWGRGVGGVIVDQALQLLPAVYDARSLWARVAGENLASVRVLTRRGFLLTDPAGNRTDSLDLYVRELSGRPES